MMMTAAAVVARLPATPATPPGRLGAPRILVALDGSPEAAAALPRALALAAVHAAAVSVVRVVPGAGALAAAGADLAAVAGGLQAAGLPPRRLRLAVRVGRCPETALDQARREGADWLFLPPPAPGGQPVLTRPRPR
jgi:nucleotide-binding universal stress UspA family protein